jgi:hypothetical protein
LEAKELLTTIAKNHDDWNIKVEDEIKAVPKKRGIIKLSNEDMKDAIKSIKEKGIKTSDLKELSERGIKLPIDEPCFPIQVHSISPSDVEGKEPQHIDTSSIDKFNEFASHQHYFDKNIKLTLMENSHKIKFLRESLNSSVDFIKMIVKHCTMMGNQIEQMVFLQNKLYEKVLANERQVCGVNTRQSCCISSRGRDDSSRECLHFVAGGGIWGCDGVTPRPLMEWRLLTPDSYLGSLD